MAAGVPRASKSSTTATKPLGCPIVGIGGSAGGFEAAMDLLRHLSPRTGMAFVIVQHLDPHHGSRLPNLYSLRVRPYRTTDNKIDGVVITLVDIDGEKETAADRRSKKDGPSRK